MNILIKSNTRLIEDRRFSVSYRINDRYRKYYKYSNVEHAKFEYDMQNIFRSHGINTPLCYKYGFDNEVNMSYIECDYHAFQRIDFETINSIPIKDQILEIIGQINQISICELVRIDNKKYINDIKNGLSYVKDDYDYDGLMTNIMSGKLVVCHGDFTLDNLALDENGKVVLFDFQNVSFFCEDWDIAFLIATIPPEIGKQLIKHLDEQLLNKIRLAAAIRYGRGIRKMSDLNFRYQNYRYWKGLKV